MIEIKSLEHAEAIAYGLEQAAKVGAIQMGQRGDDAVVVTTYSLYDPAGWVCGVDGEVRSYDGGGSQVAREATLLRSFDQECAEVLYGLDAADAPPSIWRRLLRFVLPTRR